MARLIDDVFAEVATWWNVAHELSKRGIKGTPECTDKCPMAVYIISETSPDEVSKISVDTGETTIWNREGVERKLENPANMNQFIPDFDEGEYRDLLDDPSYFAYLDEGEDDWIDDFEDWDDEDDEGDEEEPEAV